jgi:hypothetical protein
MYNNIKPGEYFTMHKPLGALKITQTELTVNCSQYERGREMWKAASATVALEDLLINTLLNDA